MIQIQNKYLSVAYEEFQVRLTEVESYINFVKKISDIDHPSLMSTAVDLSRDSYDIDRELIKTLRASSYLMLYNLLESTMSNAINSIHETIIAEKIDIMNLSEELHKIILTNLQKGLSESKITEMTKNHEDHRDKLFELGYNKNKLFSGNIDCDVMKKYARKYGFQIHPYKYDDVHMAWNPEFIRTIKQKRNNLAHGSESFAICGKNMPIEDLAKSFDSVKAVLLGVFSGLNQYMDERKYLRKQMAN